MSTEKRGSEKLLNNGDSLCELTAEELELVAGMGPVPVRWKFPDIEPRYVFPDFFPLGEPDPQLFKNQLDRFVNRDDLRALGR
ncbi:MAG: hypothetical protein AB8B97_26630 [Granulosicoccus sp.]